MRNPSKALEKYSALPWPCAWVSSAGPSASDSMASAISAPARLTKDSSASDSSPTEPVSHQAAPLSRMVESAAAIERYAQRFSEVDSMFWLYDDVNSDSEAYCPIFHMPSVFMGLCDWCGWENKTMRKFFRKLLPHHETV